MPSTDNVVLNVRERPLSTDLNDLQSMIGRSLADALQYMFSQESTPAGPGQQSTSIKDVVLGGLTVAPSGSNLTVNPGALAQYSAALSPAPGALDSSYRLGMARTSVAVTAPAPVGDTWYLLEAQVVNVVTSTQSRDIFDAGTGVFAPQNVPKQQERRLTFQLKAGTITQIPTVDTDWVPIAGIFRPAGGGAVLDSHILDMRPVWSKAAREYEETHAHVVERYTMETSGTLREAKFDFSAWTNVGRRLFARAVNAFVDIGSTAFASPGGTALTTARRFHYLYLCAPRGHFVRNLYTDVESNGMLVISRVAPTQSGRNSAVIPLPTPFLGVDAATGDAVLVGIVTTASTTALAAQDVSSDGVCTLAPQSLTSYGVTLFIPATTTDTKAFNIDTVNGGVECLPYGANAIVLVAAAVPSGGSGDIFWQAPSTVFEIQRFVGSESAYLPAYEVPSRTVRGTHTLRVVLGGTGPQFTLKLEGWRL